MFQINIRNLSVDPIPCDAKNTKLLSILLQHTDIMHACGGKGRCTTCRIKILAGEVAPIKLTQAEQRFSDHGRLKCDERLSCQISVEKDLDLEIPDGCKLPHLTYVY